MLLQLPNFNALFIVSLIAAVTSISYSTIGWVSAVADGKAADVSYAIKGDGIHKLMGIFNALGTCVFAYGGHSVVLEIQVSMPGCTDRLNVPTLGTKPLNVWTKKMCSDYTSSVANLGVNPETLPGRTCGLKLFNVSTLTLALHQSRLSFALANMHPSMNPLCC